MNSRTKGLVAGGAAIVAILLAASLYFAFGPAQSARLRHNTLAAATYYMQKGDYDRALDLLDKLLIDNADDSEAQALRDKAMSDKTAAENAKNQELAQAESSGQKAIAQSLERLGKNLKSGSGGTVQPQENPADAAAKAQAAEEAARKKAEADAEAARKKAEAEQLAQKSKELQDKMRAVNDLVDKGSKAADGGDFPGADKFFSDAESKFPDGEDKFAGQKLAEIADALYSGSKKNPGSPADAALKESIQTARDAKKKDPANALPYYTLGKINSDLNQIDNAITELKQAASLDPNNYLYSYALGIAYFKARRYEDARQAFQATTTLNPRFERAYYNLGIT
ncbi:MAG TPA: tetratricopeptide repeat protein, partial [Rectinemataceae bacterium]|nr:tetratricopeptide repeat protein [Rectinemataceae bacterium]